MRAWIGNAYARSPTSPTANDESGTFEESPVHSDASLIRQCTFEESNCHDVDVKPCSAYLPPLRTMRFFKRFPHALDAFLAPDDNLMRSSQAIDADAHDELREPSDCVNHRRRCPTSSAHRSFSLSELDARGVRKSPQVAGLWQPSEVVYQLSL